MRIVFALIVVAIALLVSYFLVGDQFAAQIQNGDQWIRLIYPLGYLILVSGSVIALFQADLGKALRYAVIWLLIFGIIGGVYTLGNAFNG